MDMNMQIGPNTRGVDFSENEDIKKVPNKCLKMDPPRGFQGPKWLPIPNHPAPISMSKIPQIGQNRTKPMKHRQNGTKQ